MSHLEVEEEFNSKLCRSTESLCMKTLEGASLSIIVCFFIKSIVNY